MRERYLEAFDAVRIDCLNGDKYKTGKVAPDGSPDRSIFSFPGDPVGIQGREPPLRRWCARRITRARSSISPFDIYGAKPKDEEALLEISSRPNRILTRAMKASSLILPLGLPFKPTKVSEGWFDWPALPDLFPASFPGVVDQPRFVSRGYRSRSLKARVSAITSTRI